MTSKFKSRSSAVRSALLHPYSVRMRWLRRIALVLAALLVVALAVGAGYEATMRRRALREFPPAGRMVDIGGRRMQLDCRGTGSPIVVLESGLGTNGSLAWALVHDAIAATTRTCAYSRAGLMWSDASPGPHGARAIAADLKATLDAAGERGPYVLVGHSIGGAYVMVFTRLFPGDVAGLVLVDASHPDQRRRFREAVGDRAVPQFGVEKLGAALAWTGLVRLAVPPDAASKLPASIEAATTAFVPTSLGALLEEADALEATLADAGSQRSFGDLPLVVLTAMAPLEPAELAAMQLDPSEGQRFKAVWKSLQDDEATWSTRSEHVVLTDSTHYIQIDRPDAVISAVASVVERVRAPH